MSTGYVDATAEAVAYCEEMAAHASSTEQDVFAQMASCLQQKLYHPLTLLLLEWTSNPNNNNNSFNEKNHFTVLYDKVVRPIQSKLNPLSWVRMAANIDHANNQNNTTTPKPLLLDELLQELQTNDKKSDNNASVPESSYLEAKIYAQSKWAVLHLEQMQSTTTDNDALLTMDVIQTQIKEQQEMIALHHDSISKIVQAAHYQQTMMYYKVKGPPEAFYQQALQYLQYHTLDEQEPETKLLAQDLCVAALTGEGVYNLGLVIQQKTICNRLKLDHPWLLHLLQACANGDLTLFQSYIHNLELPSPQEKEWILPFQSILLEKVTLVALMNFVLEKNAHERVISFHEIAQRLQLPEKQVEWVCMRALSLELLHGHMDEVDQQLTVQIVQPRHLQSTQIAELAVRMGEWADQVQEQQNKLNQQTKLLFA